MDSLTRVPVIRNPNYKPAGLKSYAYLLNKYQFAPTLEGPFQMLNDVLQKSNILEQFGVDPADQESFVRDLQQLAKDASKLTFKKLISGKARAKPRQLVKKDTTTGKPGLVGAQDQQNDSLYLCPVQIGTPAQTVNLDFDTGSSDLWVWSTELDKQTQASGAETHQIFNASKSSTYKKSSFSTWKISYGDGSSASGIVGTDLVTVGGLTIKAQAVELANKLSTEFQQGAGDGLLGLAFGTINTVKPRPVQTPVENMITQRDIPKAAELFTVYLGSWRDANEDDKGESFYTFGYIDQDIIKKNGGKKPYYTPVDSSDGFWKFASASATVNGKKIARAGNTAIADTGTTLALVDDATCQAIYAAIPGAVYDSTNQGWTFPTGTAAAKLPVVTFAVGGKQFPVQKEDLAFASVSSTMVYGGIQSRGDLDFDILGDTFLKGIYAIFDQGGKRFGAVKRIEKYQNVSAPQQ
ncbi:aspartic proteinase precursor [Mytilinidion resinicola]|uniref:Aspartic proteinase n=1 Tax=Mytilinidion resinicola TaxID=574789 RepID=A0A6A6YUI1_9PEZI|nr:aspartic proteinase precursor [Mytilinidion resinicola]KAF2812043.1 aspartic proteinase precursor [Mytilinidion resinicola]